MPGCLCIPKQLSLLITARSILANYGSVDCLFFLSELDILLGIISRLVLNLHVIG